MLHDVLMALIVVTIAINIMLLMMECLTEDDASWIFSIIGQREA